MTYSNEPGRRPGDVRGFTAARPAQTGKKREKKNSSRKFANFALAACLAVGVTGLGQEVMALGRTERYYRLPAVTTVPQAVEEALSDVVVKDLAARYSAESVQQAPAPYASLGLQQTGLTATADASSEAARRAAIAAAEKATAEQAAAEKAAAEQAEADKAAAEQAEAEKAAAEQAEADKAAAEQAEAEKAAAEQAEADKAAAEQAEADKAAAEQAEAEKVAAEQAEADKAAAEQAEAEKAAAEQAEAEKIAAEQAEAEKAAAEQAEADKAVKTSIAIEKVDEVLADVEAKTAEYEAEQERQAKEAEQQSFLEKRRAIAENMDPDLLKLYLGVVAAECGSTWDYDGCLRIAQVIMNRVNSGYWGDLRGVLTAPDQFSVYASGAWASKQPTEAQREAALDALAGKKIFADDIIFFCTDAAYARSSYFKGLNHKDTFANTLFFAK